MFTGDKEKDSKISAAADDDNTLATPAVPAASGSVVPRKPAPPKTPKSYL